MALMMGGVSEALNESERADLDAIEVLKVSTAHELKEQGNQYVKKGKKHYSDAIDCYTRAINQKALSESDTSVLFANRAHVNLLLGNSRRALTDAEEAIKLSPSNFKAHYRAAKAALSLDLLTEATSFCQAGIQQSLDNDELKKLLKQISLRRSQRENRGAQAEKALVAAKDLASAIEDRGLKLGRAMYQELTGLKKPILDVNNILHWPVLLLYAEVMSSDIIEDFCETETFSFHLDMMLSEGCPPLPWDNENAYTRDAVELYYETGGVPSTKADVLQFLLEGTAGSLAESSHDEIKGNLPTKWVKVDERKILCDVLRQPDFVIPRIPVFYVVSKRSSFYKDFKAGKWVPPP